MNTNVITVPHVDFDLEQFLSVIRQLDEPTRVRVARVLAETEMDAELQKLISHLAQSPPADDISDANIQTEIEAVRREHK